MRRIDRVRIGILVGLVVPGEALIQISGVLLKQGDTTAIGSLSLKTTKRTVGPIGKVLDGPKFALDASQG